MNVTTEAAVPELSAEERRAFVDEATAWLHDHADRRASDDATAGPTARGEGTEIALMASAGDIDAEREQTARAKQWQADAYFLCSAPGLRVAGGADEIQHDILGERVLGLLREPGRS